MKSHENSGGDDPVLRRQFPGLDDEGYVRAGRLDRVPENVSFLAPSPNHRAADAEIGFKWHPATQHGAIENFQPPSYYEDYVMTATYSDKMQRLQASQMARLVALHDGGCPNSFVEIGCGDGSFMKYAKQRVPRVCGIEASRRFAEEAAKSGQEVLVGFVGSEVLLTNEKFESFASRQVFEHLPDPLDVLIGIRRMLVPGAVGLIEVPNGQRALRLKRFFEFFPDHINYFSVNSLVALATDAGFNAVACHEAFDGDYLELWLRHEPDQAAWFSEMAADRARVCSTLIEKVKEAAGDGHHVAVWGCGAKTLSILATCRESLWGNILCVIDSDPHKHGLYVPNSPIPVVSPAVAADMKPDVVLVLALSYREEIADAARRAIPSCKKVFTLDDQGMVVAL